MSSATETKSSKLAARKRKADTDSDSDSEDDKPISKGFKQSAAASDSKGLADVLNFIKGCSAEDRSKVCIAINAQIAGEREAKTRTAMATIKNGDKVKFVGKVRGKAGQRFYVTGVVVHMGRTKLKARDDKGTVWNNIPASTCTVVD